KVDFQCGAGAVGIDVVVVVSGVPEALVARAGRRATGYATWRIADGDAGYRAGARAGHVVDVAGVVFVPADQTDRRAFAERDVEHAVEGLADAAVGDLVGADLVIRRKRARIGLVG